MGFKSQLEDAASGGLLVGKWLQGQEPRRSVLVPSAGS